MAFNHSTRCNFDTVTINDVQGNQIHNHYNQLVQQDQTERTIYDEFYDIKRGAIYRLRDLYRENHPGRRDVSMRETWETGLLEVNRTISVAEIHPEKDRKFTTVSYSGADAKEAWRRDFKQFLEPRSDNMQLFGINRSSIPMLIFYNELVPIGHIWDQLNGVGQVYFDLLAKSLGGYRRELWIDSTQGTLIHGVAGPSCPLGFLASIEVKTISSSIDLLQDDTLWRYLSRLPLNRKIDNEMIYVFEKISLRQPRETKSTIIRPIIFSTQTNSTIAVGNVIWVRNSGDCFGPRVTMTDGRARFTLFKDFKYHKFVFQTNIYEYGAWLSQASSIFHRLGISMTEDLSYYKVIIPRIHLEGHIDVSGVSRHRRQNAFPIYLFIPPIPSSRFFWSRDKNGQSRISSKECERLGLPIKTHIWSMSPIYDWKETFCETAVYKDLHKWQVLRGFDPRTTEFARYLGYPIYEVVQRKSSRFEELDTDNEEEFALDQLFYGTDVPVGGELVAVHNDIVHLLDWYISLSKTIKLNRDCTSRGETTGRVELVVVNSHSLVFVYRH